MAGQHDAEQFADYVALLRDGRRADNDQPLYRAIAEKCTGLSEQHYQELWHLLQRYWGRILGHETVVTIVRVGSDVHKLRDGIGYRDGEQLEADYVDFQPGQRCVLQSRIARYQRPVGIDQAIRQPCGTVRGVQLLGGNITDLAAELGGAYAQYVRLNRQIICSGSILHLPDSVDPISGALVEPMACALDCFEKTTHEIGQDDGGSLLKKGVMPGGNVCVIGSGSMAILCAKIALMNDPILKLGGAARVLFVVRSDAKAALVQSVTNDPRVSPVICTNDAEVPRQTFEHMRQHDAAFRGFDDVIVAGGGAETIAAAHRIIAPTGARIMAFAGTRGRADLDSGVWHYHNAGVLGTSGCNTKMMENALALLARESLDVRGLSGKAYTFADLTAEDGVERFFTDRHLRPKLLPNEGLDPCRTIEN